jgi:predicted nucleotidyltransferase
MKPEVLGAGYYKLSEPEKIALTKRITTFLFQRAEIVFAFLYGSFLREKFFRDIDIGVFVKNGGPEGYSYESKLADDLEQELDFLLPIEIRTINSAPVIFNFQVIRGKLLLKFQKSCQSRLFFGRQQN